MIDQCILNVDRPDLPKFEENSKPLPREKMEEKDWERLEPAADGKVHVANNGIFNDLKGAETYARQHSTADGPQYFAAFPKAQSPLGEFFVAGYQKTSKKASAQRTP